MKKLLFLFIAVCGMVSCNSDDGNQIVPVTNSGWFKHLGKTYSVNHAYIMPVYTGNDPNYTAYKRRFYLGFSDGNITWGDNYFIYGDDVHQLIDFDLFTSATNPSNMNNTFTFPSGDSPNMDTPYISSSNTIYDMMINNGEAVDYVDHDSNMMIATGSININSLNGIYSISYSVIDNDGDTVIGEYFGTLTVIHTHGS